MATTKSTWASTMLPLAGLQTGPVATPRTGEVCPRPAARRDRHPRMTAPFGGTALLGGTALAPVSPSRSPFDSIQARSGSRTCDPPV
jgi:hypothetical protein